MNKKDNELLEICTYFLRNYYGEVLEAHSNSNKPVLVHIDSQELDDSLKNNYSEYLPRATLHSDKLLDILGECSNNIIKESNPKFNQNVNVILTNFPENIMLHDINTQTIGNVVSTVAMIKNITPTIPKLHRPYYYCKVCGYRFGYADVNTALPICECGSHAWAVNSQESEFIDYQLIKLEEPLELRQGGEYRSFLAELEGYEASPFYRLSAGDVCKIYGTVEIHDDKKNNLTFRIKLDDIAPIDKTYDEIALSESDEQEIKHLSQDNDIFFKLRDSILPNVDHHEEVKEGLLLIMFSGSGSHFNGKPSTIDRKESHCLLVGDPGVGKSQCLEGIHKVAPKSIKSNGAGTTQAGITASAVRDALNDVWTLEAGAFVLADGGIITIDEFDKLKPEVMESLNEPLENLSVSVSKAGITSELTSRACLVAGANPKYGKWRDDKSFDEQVKIPNTTLSRFDLIFVLRDNVDYDSDFELAQKILIGQFSDEEKLIDLNLVKKYINYAKNTITPHFTKESNSYISKFYADIRQASLELDDGKLITARELGAIKRLSIARARIELRDYVTVDDAKCAIEVYKNSLASMGLDIYHAGDISNVYSDVELNCLNDCEDYIHEAMQEFGCSVPRSEKDAIISDLMNDYNIELHRMRTIYSDAYENIVELIDKK